MVLPLIPIAAAVGGSLIGGGIVSAFGGSKKASATEQHATQEHYAPVTTDARSFSQVTAPSTVYQIESPGATARTESDITSTARSSPAIRTEREQGAAPSVSGDVGTNLPLLVGIGAAGLIIYGAVSKK